MTGDPPTVYPPETLMQTEIDSVGRLHAAIIGFQNLPYLHARDREERVLLSTVVSELGTNILKFAGQGRITISRRQEGARQGVQIQAWDQGPGIANVAQALEEGFSSAGTLGLGLPAVRRIMDELTIDSHPGAGARVVATKWFDMPVGTPAGAAPAPVRENCLLMKLDWAAVNRPYPHETGSGDATLLRPLACGLLCGVIDVAGHGAEAHALALTLEQTARDAPTTDPEALLKLLHRTALGTRGAAAGLALINTATGRMQFAGVGNVWVRVLGEQRWRGVSRDGILGERMRNVLVQAVALHPGDLLVMASDGISESRYSSALVRGTPLRAERVARRLLHDAGKTTDDASCVVVRCL